MLNGNYVLIKAPLAYPGKTYRGKLKLAYEHHVVWWQNTGQTVPLGCHVHHKDSNRLNNDFNNLELLTKEAHSARHAADNFVVMWRFKCAGCQVDFDKARRLCNGKSAYCCRNCIGYAAGTPSLFIGEFRQYKNGKEEWPPYKIKTLPEDLEVSYRLIKARKPVIPKPKIRKPKILKITKTVDEVFSLFLSLNGNFSKTARVLDVTDNAVRKFLRRHGKLVFKD